MSESKGKHTEPHDDASETPHSDVAADERVADLEARLIEQEHRTAHVALNAYKYFGDEKNEARKSAAMKALFWRVFAPYTAAAVFASTGSLVGGLSAYFLYQQNEKLGAQTKLLERQVEIQAGDGKWEQLWNAHYHPRDSIRIKSAQELANAGVKLSGVYLKGKQPPRVDPLQARLHYPRIWEHRVEAGWVKLTDLPSGLMSSILEGDFHSLRIQIDGDRGDNRFYAQNSEVNLGESSTVRNCRFVNSHVVVETGNAELRRCILDGVAISPSFDGTLTIYDSEIKGYVGNPTRDSYFRRRNGSRLELSTSTAHELGIYGNVPVTLLWSTVEVLQIFEDSSGVAEDAESRESALASKLAALDIGPNSCVQKIVVFDGKVPEFMWSDDGDVKLGRYAEKWLRKERHKCRGEGRKTAGVVSRKPQGWWITWPSSAVKPANEESVDDY